jgi:hypothetical protein
MPDSTAPPLWLASWWVMVSVPILLILMTCLVKAVAKDKGLQVPEDLYLGAEFAIAAMTASLIAACTLAHRSSQLTSASIGREMNLEMNLLVFTVVCLFVFALIVSFHHSHERSGRLRDPIAKWQLGVVFNLLGLLSFGGFVLLFWSI